MTDAPLIEVRGLRSQFGSHVVHDNLGLEVRQGEILGIVALILQERVIPFA